VGTKFYTTLRGEKKVLTVVGKNARLVALQPAGKRTPFFMVESYASFVEVVKLMGTDRPVLSLIAQEEAPLSQVYSISLEAAEHVKTILDRQPQGPYMLGGCSAKGIVAYEIAQQLQTLGHDVALLVLFDTPNWRLMPGYKGIQTYVAACRSAFEQIRWGNIPGLDRARKSIFRQSARLERVLRGMTGAAPKIDQLEIAPARVAAASEYLPAPYYGRVLLVMRHRGLSWQMRFLEPDFGWGETVRGGLEICIVEAASHFEIFKSEGDRVLVAQALRRCFDQVEAGPRSQLSEHSASERRDEALPHITRRNPQRPLTSYQ